MLTAAILSASCLAGCAALWRLGRHERQFALKHRAALLDEVATLFPNPHLSLGADGFPTLAAALPEGAVRVSLLADTLVTRRLPQLWLVLTLREREAARDFSLGCLARPTGAEFYALTPGLPDWIPPPLGDVPLLVRGRNIPPETAGVRVVVLAGLLADPQWKEAAVTPRGVRVVRQVCQGERGAHLLLRQAHFAMNAVPAAAVAEALAQAKRLGATVRSGEPALLEAA